MNTEHALKKINNSRVYKSIIRLIEHVDILGLEESFECKRRFTSIKCISNNGELYKISVIVYIG
jgi:hypothetical protein